MRIAFFVGVFPAVSETFIVRQITGLLERGHEVDIFADTRAEPGTPVHADVSSFQLLDRTTWMDMPPETSPWEMPVWPLTARTWPPGSSRSVHNCVRFLRALPKMGRCLLASPSLGASLLRDSEYGYRARSLSQVYRMARLLKKRSKYDVLHAHFGPVAESYRFARQLWRAPLVASFHGYDFTTVPRKEGRNVYAKLFRTADAITANSQFTLERLTELGCSKDILHRLPAGLDLSQFRFRERTRAPGEPVRILTIARLVPIKGVSVAIESMAKVRKVYPEVHLDIVGDGPLRSELEKRAHQLGLATIVTFHGALAGEPLQRLMDAAHIFLHLCVTIEGDQEGQGLVLQEAQAAGLPVVATRHGAFPEGVGSESGFLVPEGDPDAAGERLLYLIENCHLWPEMGRKGRAFVGANFNIQKLNARLEELYYTVIADFSRK